MRVPRRSTIALATAGALASTGTAYLGARNLLVGQATHARTVIPKSFDAPPRADGVYTRGGGPVQRWRREVPFDVHLMIFGDSTATGYGCASAEEVPGVLIARGLAEQTGKRIRLSTKAIVGATSKGVCGQVDAMFVVGPPPDAAVIMIGANDITALNGIGPSAQRLADCVRRLRTRGRSGGRHLPRPRRHYRHPAAAARASAHPWCAAGPRPNGSRQGGRWGAGAARTSTGSQIPGNARADVLRRPLPPVGARVRPGGRSVVPCAARCADRKARYPNS